MKRTPLRRRAKLRARKPLERSSSPQRTRSMVATDAQRAAVAGRNCIVCGTDRRIDPAHLMSVMRRDGATVLPACSLIDMSARERGSQRVLAELGRRRREATAVECSIQAAGAAWRRLDRPLPSRLSALARGELLG